MKAAHPAPTTHILGPPDIELLKQRVREQILTLDPVTAQH